MGMVASEHLLRAMAALIWLEKHGKNHGPLPN
jgi:hypothetical protein